MSRDRFPHHSGLPADCVARIPVLTEEMDVPLMASFERVDERARSHAAPAWPRPRVAVAAAAASVAEPNAPSSDGEKLIQLLDYLEETERLGARSQHHLPLAHHFCAWESEVEHMPGVALGESAGPGVWMRIQRLQDLPPPSGPAAFMGWLTPQDDPNVEPELQSEQTDEAAGSVQDFDALSADDQVAVHGALIPHLAAWRSWATLELKRRRTIGLYAKLFALQQSIELGNSSSPVELVWGVGVATWRLDVRTPTRYPVVTKLVEIALDGASLALTIRPRDAESRLELSSFSTAGSSGIRQVTALAQALMSHETFEFSPFATASIEPVLRSVVSNLDAEGIYVPDDRSTADPRQANDQGSEHLRVGKDWVLFTRPRGSNFLLDDVQRLRQAIGVQTVPGGSVALVTAPSKASPPVPAPAALTFRGLSMAPGVVAGRLPYPQADLYFPKPYNDEQVSIISLLESSDGVVVQGPPGTGKTHNIANVICHYLATGRTVLVTSKGEPALAALRDHIPEGIRDLTVNLLTSERDGMAQFERAIGKILGDVSRLDPCMLQSQVAELEAKVGRLHEQMADIHDGFRSSAVHHMTRVVLSGRHFTASELAQYVVDEAPRLGWMEPIAWENTADDTVEDALLQRAGEARLLLGQRLGQPQAKIDLATLPGAAEILTWHNDARALFDIESSLGQSSALPVCTPAAQADRLEAFARALDRALQQLNRVPGGWVGPAWGPRLLAIVAGDPDSDQLDHIKSAMHEMQGLLRERKPFVKRPVKLPTVEPGLRQLHSESIGLLSQGKKAFGWFSSGRKRVRGLVNRITIGELTPANPADWQHVIDYMEHSARITAVVARWNGIAEELDLPIIAGPKELRSLLVLWHQLSALLVAGQEIAPFAERLLEPLFEPLQASPAAMQGTSSINLAEGEFEHQAHGLVGLDAWVDPRRWSAWAAHARLCARRLWLMEGEKSRGRLARWAQLQPDPVRQVVSAFALDLLGSPSTDDGALKTAWAGCLNEINEMNALSAAVAIVSEASTVLSQAGAPKWAARLASDPVVDVEDPCIDRAWREAWAWSRARDWLNHIDKRGALREAQIDRKRLEKELSDACEHLVEKRTWQGISRNATPAVKSALNAYMSAVRMLGKGTGVRANRYRKDARQAMVLAYKAVPCWIMPHWRVSEALPSDLGGFDLVIIDEASQSDLWALPSLLRGKKVLVVGDDHQVSPDGIGLDEDKVQSLAKRYLDGQVFGAEMAPEKSIYDLARVAFAGSQVTLREHFRCAPSIIQFSNREFYNGEIRPLRLPRASEHLEPPLVDVRVVHGSRDAGGKINRAEARAIVDQIKAFCADPSMASRTIGVVSLLGHPQAQLIDLMVRQEIDERDIVDHQIACGDARTFQGKERDIMMLSLVVDAASTIAATRREFQQRYNVATSRARDQMWLFRSVDLDDLNPADLRFKLISHVQTSEHLLSAARALGRDACRSPFELEIFDALTSLGYQVAPQVEVGVYRIDLVVSGRRGARLAIGCDGDRSASVTQWDLDLRHQRVLERAGWTFWRCFAATFKLRPAECVTDLVRTLSLSGIDPIGPGPRPIRGAR